MGGVLRVLRGTVVPGGGACLSGSRCGVARGIAWGVGSLTLVTGVVVSFATDIPTGPLLVCMFGLAVVVALVVRFLTGVRPGSAVQP